MLANYSIVLIEQVIVTILRPGLSNLIVQLQILKQNKKFTS